MKLLVVFSLLLVAACVSVQGQTCTGRRVTPDLPDFNHNVSGILYIQDSTTYCIQNFYYDGAGPDAFLYLYLPGDPTFIKGGGVITPVPGREDIRTGQFEVGRRYLGETLIFQVPDGHRTCDYGAFGIWCRYASQLFTAVTSLEPNFSLDGADSTIVCTPSPGRAFLGSLPTDNNGISGDVFAVSNKQFTIRDFTYDGSAAEEVSLYFFRPGETAVPSDTAGVKLGTALPSGTPVDEAAFEIVIPEAMDIFTCDFSTLVIAGNETLATLTINLGTAYANNQDLADHDRSLVFCDRPATRPGVLVGELTSESNGLGGTFYVRDDKTFYIQLFSYDARATAPTLYYYRRGQEVEDTGHGYRIGFSNTMESLPSGLSNSYKKITPFIVNLNYALDEDDVSACDVEWFTIWDPNNNEHFTRIQIPESIFTEDANDAGIAQRTRVLCSQTNAEPTPRAGAPPTVSLVSTLTICVIVMVTMLLKA
ncbi:uncharacterized protein LOC135345151 [Halichondria panicea]|uniref:uncharacterized protein LOC135345151 n=1 Tax=Halichondria panicea TaxID=6063 RepID=UPI00312B882C